MGLIYNTANTLTSNPFRLRDLLLLLISLMLLASGCSEKKKSGTLARPVTAPSAPEEPTQLAAPTIGAPASNPYTSADSNFNLTGFCITNATVTLAGDQSDTTTCNAGSFSFTISEASDGTYNYSITQANGAGTTSSAVSFEWTRNSSLPATPTISAPATSPFYSNGSSLVISGSCVDGNTVNLSNAATDSAVCASSSFSFTVNKATDDTYTFSVVQVNPSSLSSGAASVIWVRDTVNPSAPAVTSPAVSPHYSNGNSLVVSGSCETNATIYLSGDDTQNVTCAANAYSFTINKVVDGTYNFSITQNDLAGNGSSGLSSMQWVRDTVAPAAPVVSDPTSNEFTSGDSSFDVTGTCAANATVYLQEYTSSAMTTTTGSAASIACAGGTYALTSPGSKANGTYYYGVYQTDRASNASAKVGLTWVRDGNILATPTVQRVVGGTPEAISGTIYSNGGSIVIRASCLGTGYELSNTATSSSPVSPSACSSAYIDFTISEASEGDNTYYFWQENTAAATSSSTVSVRWVKDTTAPSAPVITAPGSTPYTAPGNLTISGTCEEYATVALTVATGTVNGTTSGTTSGSVTCSGGAFTFLISKSVDDTYPISVAQTDRAGNASASSATLNWVRDSNSVPPPTLTSPSADVINNASSISLSGTCNSGYDVTLSGVGDGTITVPASGATQVCNGGSFLYTITKATQGTLNFSLIQTFNSVNSSPTTRSWTRDTVVPTVTISSAPAAENLLSTVIFEFSANETVDLFECSLDGGAYAACVSPYSLATLANGNHTMAIRATDSAGNRGAASPEIDSHSWDQQAYKTIALYHLDTADLLTNSSSYSGAYEGTLTHNGTVPEVVSGKFSEAYGPFSGANYFSAAHNDAFTAIKTAITVEGFWNAASISNGTYSLVSKNGNSSGTYGWELQLVEANGTKSCKFQLKLTTANTTVPSNIQSSGFACNNGAWNHFAATWSAGAVKFFFNGKQVGSGTFGNTATILGSNSEPLIVGDGSGTAWVGALDEVRISQIARTFTATPSAAYTAD